MLLNDLQTSDLVIGKIVVLMQKENCSLVLRIIESLDMDFVYLAPAAIILDDLDVTEKITISECIQNVKVPIFQRDDPILFKDRKGRVLSCSTNDFHVYVTLEEFPGKEFYTNLIHLNFAPSLELFKSQI